jgi:RNA polymerase sigma factor (sigma-70 family)
LDEIGLLIARATEARAARDQKGQAFAEIVRRFQDLAFGCAYAVLGDFHLAQDAAQEAFLTAWRNLDQLRAPEAFPGWFKRIVLTQCNRQTRGKRLGTVSLDAVADLAAADPDPADVIEERERRAEVLEAIRGLPEHERMVTTLYYVGDYAQAEIAAFLELPVGTVKKRLHSARRRLRERMLEMVRETLRETRPSRDERFAETVALFNAALEGFVAKVKQDRYVIAAILYGSLAHDTVWRKSDIDILLVARDDKLPGGATGRGYCLVENGVNIHAELVPRSRFKQGLEGALQGSFGHSSFALSTLLYTTDDTIRAYYDNVRSIGARDRQLRLMIAGNGALGALAKAEKWLVTRGDVAYSFVWIMYTLSSLAEIEVLLRGEMTGREVLPQALRLNPDFFGDVYHGLIHREKDEAEIGRALDRINAYVDCKTDILFGPILEYLAQEGGIRTTSELDAYFRKQVQTEWGLSNAYEWLADKGVIQKVPSPVRLTQKSQVTVDEAAYYYDRD